MGIGNDAPHVIDSEILAIWTEASSAQITAHV